MIGSRFQADHNRKMLVQDVKDMLKLMSIEYECHGLFKLRVVPQQEIEDRKKFKIYDDLLDATGIMTYHQGLAVTQAKSYAKVLGVDLAKKDGDKTSRIWGTRVGLNGQHADTLIIDDITYDDAFIQPDPTKKP